MPNASGRKRVHDDDGPSDCGVVWGVVVGALVVSDMFVVSSKKKREKRQTRRRDRLITCHVYI